jgi:hypothetical protein
MGKGEEAMRRVIALTVLLAWLIVPGLSRADEQMPDEFLAHWGDRVEEALDFVAAEDPELAQALVELRVHDPDAFMREIFHVMFERTELERLSGADQQRFLRTLRERELDRRSHRLAREWHEASQDESERLKTELRALLEELFDVREVHRADQIAELERELERLRTTLEERQADRDAIVEGRLKELLGQEDHLRW